MPNKFFLGSQRLLSDPNPLKEDLAAVLDDDGFYSLDLDVYFKGETIRTERQLYGKLESLFEGLRYRDLRVTRQGNDFHSQAVVDKENFLGIIRNNNYGVFDGDYTFVIKDFQEFVAEDEDTTATHGHDENVLKPTPAENIVDGMNEELTITVRRGPDPTDRPARGLQTFNLMSDPAEVIKVLKHFKIEKKISRVTKPTPQRPTLQVRLTSSVDQLFGEDEYIQPCLIYDPTSQSMEAGYTQLYAHLHSSSESLARRIVIEGIHGIINLSDVKHRLQYHGELISDIKPLFWNLDGEDCLSGIPNGEVCVFMKLKYEINYLVFGRESFRVTYQNQPVGCSICFSWLHRSASCDMKNVGRDQLRSDYLQKWKRMMNFEERRPEEPFVSGDQKDSGCANKPGAPTSPDSEPLPGINLCDKEPRTQGNGESSNEPGSPTSSEPPVLPGDQNELSDPTRTPENNSLEKATRNLEKLFGDNETPELSSASLEKIATTTPASILNDYAEVYRADLPGPENIEELATVGSNVTATEPEIIKDQTQEDLNASDNESETIEAQAPEKPKATDAEPTDLAATTDLAVEPTNATKPKEPKADTTSGWMQAKSRKQRAKKSSAGSCSSSDSDDVDRKRKAESPKANEVKTTGSGRKKAYFAEHAKGRFFTELMKKMDEKVLADAKSSTVKSETVKRDLLEMEERYYKLIFENPAGKDPQATENWNEISKSLTETRLQLEKKAMAS